MWLKDELWSARLRPDLSGIMFEDFSESFLVVGYTSPADPFAWKRPLALQQVRLLTEVGRVVVLTSGRGTKQHIFVPKGKGRQVVDAEIRRVQEREGAL